MRTTNRIKPKAGETLVEVLASMFIFLILMGVLQGAVSYSNAALTKNKEIRRENSRILEGLQSAALNTEEKETALSFCATDVNMSEKGNIVFQVPVKLASKDAEYTDSDNKKQKVRFYLYDLVNAETQTDAGGGMTP